MGKLLSDFRCSLPNEVSQAEMATTIGASETQYSKWELRGPMPPYFLARLCKRYKTSPDHFFPPIPEEEGGAQYAFRKRRESGTRGRAPASGKKRRA